MNGRISIDMNANFLCQEIIEAGFSYRYENSVNAVFAVIINEKYSIGNAYDYKLSMLGGNLSSHKIIFHFDLNLKKK